MMQVKIAVGVIKAQLIAPSREIKLIVSELLSYEVDGAQFVNNRPGWDGRTSMLEFSSGKFPAGFIHLVKTGLEKKGYRVHVIQKESPQPIGPETPVVDAFPEDPRYDYQRETVSRLLKHKRMIAQIATGGGKSRVARIAFARIGRKCLFLTTRKTLMYQMANSFARDLGLRVGILGDSTWEPVSGFNCATVDTLVSRLEKKTYEGEVSKLLNQLAQEIESKTIIACKALKIPHGALQKFATDTQKRQIDTVREELKREQDSIWTNEKIAKHVQSIVSIQEQRRQEALTFLESVEFIILEEAHEVSGNGFYEIMNSAKNAHYRLALTATPFMKDSAEANMRLMAVTGLIGIRISEKLLIDRGILSRPYFKFLTPPKPLKIGRSSEWQRAYKIGIVENIERNKMIVKEVYRAKQYNLTSMILVQHTKHGSILVDMLQKIGLNAAFIKGDDNQTNREKWLAKLENGEIDALIGTTILDVGVDVPAVGQVITAGGGKAEVAHRQRIGRGLRAKKTGPNVCFVVDFNDDSNIHLWKHSKQRRQIIEDTPGFQEGILNEGETFAFEGLGFVKTK